MGWRRWSFPRCGVNYPFLAVAAFALFLGTAWVLGGCSSADATPTPEAAPATSTATGKLPTVDQNDPRTFLDRAYVYLRDPETYDHALADATRAIELDSSLAEAYVVRTRAYVEISHSSHAPTAALAAADGPLSRVSSAWALPLDALVERAIADANSAIKLDPNLAGAYFARAHVYLDTGRPEQAVADYGHILDLNPDIYIEVMTLAHRSRAHLALGGLGDAIQDATRAIELEPELAVALQDHPTLSDWHGMGLDSIVATAYTNRGIAYDRQGQPDTAVADFSVALERDPEYVESYANRANAYVSMGLYSEALADANRAIALNNHLAAAFNTRALAYLGLGRGEDALADVDRAIEEDPQFAMAYSNRGYIQTGLGRYDDALVATTQAINLDPTLASAYVNRAEVHLRNGDLNSALADSTAALNLDPTLASAYVNRAEAHLRQGNHKSAIADSTAALNLDPTLIGALVDRALAYLVAGEYANALSDANLAISRNPGLHKALYIRGTALSILSNGTEGTEDLNRVIQESQNPGLVELARRALSQPAP